MSGLASRARHSTLWIADGLCVLWIVLWLIVGVWVAYSLWQISAVGEVIADAGHTLESAGRSVDRLGDVPLVGSRLHEAAGDLMAAAANLAEHGDRTRSRLRVLGVGLGLVVFALPVLPILVGHLPARIAYWQDRTAVRDALRSTRHDDLLDRYLAYRLITNVPLHRLWRMVGEPWEYLGEGKCRPLADAELRRLGLEREQPRGGG